MFKDNCSMTKRETTLSKRIIFGVFAISLLVIIALSGCTTSQKIIDPIVCEPDFKPLYEACDTAYTQVENERLTLQAALETCNRKFNKNLSKSR